ncbi:MAG: superoxide dismutase family protein [Novosphingobium sp.]|uniref:superoxide dismutase family protein n=1 Tax=Tsuneonella sp. CC-YZS046 TaxID=3042152 RepID=UPI002D7A1C14|nr:superoxide dismutase family protein [Tsuneonella sp. CC-YZS046]WRO65819.1 superoxide dismutase family protein [Tsuneonella sp. CC-YZS046]
MQRHALLALAPAFVALAACSTVPQPATETLASTELKLADGQPAGTARVVSDGQGVRLIADVTGVSPGLHGIHLHTVGQCEAPAFTSAGGHLNPEGKQHGTENPAGSHLGDLPNITADESGKGSISVALHSTKEQLLNVLFDSDGTAVVVHAGPDDYKTDPAGNSGGRIACGVLARP